jgi:hypothetical protein
MANEGKFRGGASIRPVGGAGRAQAQKPNAESSSKKSGKLLRDLNDTKAEKFRRHIYLEPIASPYAVVEEDEVIYCNVNAGNIVLRLPPITGQDRRELTVKRVTTAANTVEIAGGSGVTVEGINTFITLDGADRACVTLRADEKRLSWRIISQMGTVTL